MRRIIPILAAVIVLTGAAEARAETPFGLACVTDAANANVRVCQGATATRVPSFDSTPLDVNVVLPASGDSGLPLITIMHGYGGDKQDPAATTGDAAQLGSMVDYAKRGYAVLSFAARGFKESCGSAASRLQAFQISPEAGLACQRGWIHLDDMRFEARDAQTLMGKLVDQSIVDPQRLGVTGVSYGGITSTQLAALRDRMWVFAAGADPDTATLQPFTSPKGVPMRIAAAGPSIPGSDLAYALVNNGRTTDFQIIDRKDDIAPVGVPKLTFISGLFATGLSGIGYYAPSGADPNADITTWYQRVSAGDPYDEPVAQGIVEEISRWHSGFALLSKDAPTVKAPAPTLFGNGFTDDLFPVDEALRFANRARSQFPDTPISLFFFDYGHQRGQNKDADRAKLRAAYAAWFDRHVKGDMAAAAVPGVTVLTQTCPKAAPAEGPYTATTWDALHPGEIRQAYKPTVTIGSTGGDPDVSRAVDPVAGGGACATTDAADQPEPAAATYRVGKVGTPYTLAGAPTVIAKIVKTDTQNAQLAARLWDVAPDNTQTLVARALYRPDGVGKFEVFQLHANGYRFAAGHVPKLELLGADTPYGRQSNGTFTLTVSDLELRLPVLDAPDCTQVLSHAPPFLAGKPVAPDIAVNGTPPCGAVAPAAGSTAPVGGSPETGPPATQTSVGAGGAHGTVNGQPVGPAGSALRGTPRALRHRLSCRRSGRRRARCSDRGRVTPPSATSAARACASRGNVRVRYFERGRNRRLKLRATRRVRLGSSCSYRSRARIAVRGRRVVSTARFLGNRALRARSARAARSSVRRR